MKNLVTLFLGVQRTKIKWFFGRKDFVHHFHPHGGWSIKLNTVIGLSTEHARVLSLSMLNSVSKVSMQTENFMVCELLLKLWWSFLISLFYHLTSDVEVSSLCSISLFFFFWSYPPFIPSLPSPYSSSFTHLLPPLTFPPPPSPHNFVLSAQYCTTDSAYMIFWSIVLHFPHSL